MISWFWFILSMPARGHNLLDLLYWFVLDDALITLKSDLLSQCFCFLGLFPDAVGMCPCLCQLKNSWKYSSWVFLCFRPSLLQFFRSCLLDKIFFVPTEMHKFPICIVWFRVICWLFTVLPLTYFVFSNFSTALFQLRRFPQLQLPVTLHFALPHWYWYRCYTLLWDLLFSGFWFTHIISQNLVKIYANTGENCFTYGKVVVLHLNTSIV